jgi:hypothetical protein
MNRLSGDCSNASRAEKCACSAPTAMSPTRWYWRSATITRGKATRRAAKQNRRPGTQQRQVATLESGSSLAIHRHRHASRASEGCAVKPTTAACRRERDRAPRHPVRTSARQQGCCLRCTGYRSNLAGSSRLPKMQHYLVKPPLCRLDIRVRP